MILTVHGELNQKIDIQGLDSLYRGGWSWAEAGGRHGVGWEGNGGGKGLSTYNTSALLAVISSNLQ